MQTHDKHTAPLLLPPRSDPSAVCLAHLPLSGVTFVALSRDDLVLACVQSHGVRFYSVPDLAAGHAAELLAALDVPDGVRQLAWRPAGGSPADYLLVSAAGQVSLGPAPAGAFTRPQAGVAAAWSPDGCAVALARDDQLVLQDVDRPERCSSAQVHNEMVDANAALVVESVAWVAPHAVVLQCVAVEEGGFEGGDGFCMVAKVDAAGLAAQQLFALVPRFIDPDAAGPLSGPYLSCTGASWYLRCAQCIGAFRWAALIVASERRLLLLEGCIASMPHADGAFRSRFRAAGVPEWHVYAWGHRKANDEHIKLLSCDPADGVTQIDIMEDATAIRLPNGLDGADNYVIGLALDRSYVGEPLPHPTDPQGADIAGAATLLVATSDGALRFYR